MGCARSSSSVTDYFVLASGTSEPHLRAIVEEITDNLREDYDLRPRAVDGSFQAAWVVLDYFENVIVHAMRQDVRDRYDLYIAGTCCSTPEKEYNPPPSTAYVLLTAHATLAQVSLGRSYHPSSNSYSSSRGPE